MATEEQTTYNTTWNIGPAGWAVRGGQRLTISNRLVSKLSFPLHKVGSPTGDITYTIRKVSDDSIINSKVLGDASALQASVTWEEATLDTPVNVNEEVRILVEYSGGDGDNYIVYEYQNSDVKASEYTTEYVASYTDYTTLDSAYIYTYTVAVPRSFGFIIG